LSRTKVESGTAGEVARPTQDDFGVEEATGDAGSDGDEVGLVGEDFDVAGAGEFGKVD
jgi:hypothetical protein